MFFSLSKILWFLAAPGNLFLIALTLACLMLWTRWRDTARVVAGFLAVAGVVIAIVPVGGWVNWHLENRFPVMQKLPPDIDGIVVAGGIVDPFLSHDRGQPVIGGAIERITAAAELATLYPGAKIIFSGGSGNLFRQGQKEADYVAPIFTQLGVSSERIVFENQARNTVENAEISLKLAKPQAGDTWLLVTSAFHMPRAVGTFRQAGWDILAYPTDFSSSPQFKWRFGFDFSGGLGNISQAMHEGLGLLFYRVTGKSNALFPAPKNDALFSTLKSDDGVK